MDNLIEKTLVMILCGGKGERLYPLTRDRAKPSVPFLGIYRIIDFSLSNSLNSGLHKIALLTQYKSLSLERHILHGWNIFHPESGGYILSLPAQGRVADHWYEGTADAVLQNIYTIQQENPPAVLVLSGDHIYKADYRKILRFYQEKEADAVILAKLIPREEASRFGIIEVDKNGRILNFMEKPKNPPSNPWDERSSLASMGVYLFQTSMLIKALIKDAKNRKSSHDFGKAVLPRMIQEYKVFAYPFDDYWEDIGTIDAYWNANMAFLSPSPPFNLHDPSWPVRTHKPQYPPTYIDGGTITNSIIGSGCRVFGSEIRNSIISPGATVSEGARIEGSIVFEGTEIGKKAHITRVIIDKHAFIPETFEIGTDARKDGRHFMISGEGIRVVPKNWRPD